MFKTVLNTLFGAIDLCLGAFIIVCGGSYASAQTDLWEGFWYGDRSKPSDWYKFNDAIISTGAHRLHAIGITGQGFTTAVIDSGFNTKHEIYGYGGNRIIHRDFTGDDDYPGTGFHGAHVTRIVLSMAPDRLRH